MRLTAPRLLLCLALASPVASPARADAAPVATTALSEEAEAARFHAFAEAAYQKAKTTVDARLVNLDSKAQHLFEHGTELALAAMESKVRERLLPFKGTLFGPPPEAARVYAEGKLQFEEDLRALVVRVAEIVATEIAGAKDAIKVARESVAAERAKLSPSARERVAKEERELERRLALLEAGTSAAER